MSTFIDQAIEQALAAWSANPDDWDGDNTLSNGVYSIRYRGSEGFIGMFRYLGGNGHAAWQVVDRQGVTNVSTWHCRSAEYHERESFATMKEAKDAAIRAAIDHSLNNGDGLWIGAEFRGAGS
jgi:hypothetical protein